MHTIMVIMLAYAINFPHCHVTHLRWRSPVLMRHALISFLHSFGVFLFLLLPRENIRTRGNRRTRGRNWRTRGRNRGTGGDRRIGGNRGTGGNGGTRGDRWARGSRSVDNRFCTANNMILQHMLTYREMHFLTCKLH